SLGCISFWLRFLLEPEETVDMHVVHRTRGTAMIHCNFGG
ncbi:unnamed protein product, partial [Brassica rapa subsp. trilocularis]